MSGYRYEIKFVLNEVDLLEVKQFLMKNGAQSPFPARAVNSLYFDDPDFQCVRENLSGISERSKIRLRWYDSDNNKPELEVKRRKGRLGSKNNYKLNELTTDKISKLTSNEIKKFTFSYVTKNYNYDRVLNNYLLPVLLVNYTREYYEINSEIRVTLDSNLNFRNISSEHPVTYHNKMMYNQYIMEIKFGVNQKYIVSDLIRYLNLTPKRHSKYLVGMAKIGFVNYV